MQGCKVTIVETDTQTGGDVRCVTSFAGPRPDKVPRQVLLGSQWHVHEGLFICRRFPIAHAIYALMHTITQCSQCLLGLPEHFVRLTVCDRHSNRCLYEYSLHTWRDFN